MHEEQEKMEYLNRLINVSQGILANFVLKKMWEEEPYKKAYDIIIINNCFDKITLDAVTLFESYIEPKDHKKTTVLDCLIFVKKT